MRSNRFHHKRALRNTLWAWTVALLFLAAPVPAKPWEILEHCRVVEHWGNDGDSFRVRHRGEQFIVRLYFVDTPETDSRYPGRLQEQADYFGISGKEVLEIGKRAQEFTLNLLEQRFCIRTRWQGVFGGERAARKYGMVLTRQGDLAELLVANGLARIHGVSVRGEGSEKIQRLKKLEERAKAQKKGAWGLGGETS